MCHVQAAAVACLGAALNTKAPSAALAQRLANEAAPAQPQQAQHATAEPPGRPVATLSNGNENIAATVLPTPPATTDAALACQLLELAETGRATCKGVVW